MSRLRFIQILEEGDSGLNDAPEGPLSSEGSLSAECLKGEDLLENQSNRCVLSPRKGSKLVASFENLPNSTIWKYHFPRKQFNGRWFEQYLRFRLMGSIRSIKKHLFWKVLFSRLSAAEYLVLERCVQRSWRESREAGLLSTEIAVLRALGESQRGLTKKYEQLIDRFRLSTVLISLFGTDGSTDEDSVLAAIARKMKLPDKVNPKEQIVQINFESREIPNPPPEQFVGKGYKDHGSMKKPHEVGFEILSGEQNTDVYDLVVLEILKNLQS